LSYASPLVVLDDVRRSRTILRHLESTARYLGYVPGLLRVSDKLALTVTLQSTKSVWHYAGYPDIGRQLSNPAYFSRVHQGTATFRCCIPETSSQSCDHAAE